MIEGKSSGPAHIELWKMWKEQGSFEAKANIIESYLPLVERLRGRRLAFDPNPLQLPPDTEGEIFVNPNGDYVISAISEHSSIENDLSVRRELEIKITLKVPVQEAFLMLPGHKELERIQFGREEKSIRVSIPEYKCAALIELSL